MLRTLAEVALDYDGVLVDGDGLAGDKSALVGLRIRLLLVSLHGRRKRKQRQSEEREES